MIFTLVLLLPSASQEKHMKAKAKWEERNIWHQPREGSSVTSSDGNEKKIPAKEEEVEKNQHPIHSVCVFLLILCLEIHLEISLQLENGK